MKEPQRISSRWTFFYKRVIPAVWFGLLAAMICIATGKAVARNNPEDLVPVPVALTFGILSFAIMNRSLWKLADEVWDCGNSLIVRQKCHDWRFALCDFMSVSYSGAGSSTCITLYLRKPSEMGSEIYFAPPMRFFAHSMPPIARDLMERIDAARRSGK